MRRPIESAEEEPRLLGLLAERLRESFFEGIIYAFFGFIAGLCVAGPLATALWVINNPRAVSAAVTFAAIGTLAAVAETKADPRFLATRALTVAACFFALGLATGAAALAAVGLAGGAGTIARAVRRRAAPR